VNLVILTLVVIVKIVHGASYQDCRCGQKKVSNLIEELLETKVVGGQEAKVNEFPWAALLYIKRGRDDFVCGGTLINDRFVVTAAHCIEHDKTGAIEIRLGEHDRKVRYDSEVFKTTAKDKDIIYSYKNLLKLKGFVEYDIAMLELEKPVNFFAYPHIRPACLPDEDDVNKDYPDFTFGTVVGWGATAVVENRGSLIADYKSISDVPIKLEDVEIMNQKKCDNFFLENLKEIKVNPGSFCGLSDSGDSCQGDSGGGLVYKNPKSGNYELIGIVSYGAGCNSTSEGGKKLPGVYTNIRHKVVYDWIQVKYQYGFHCYDKDEPTEPKLPPKAQKEEAHWGEWEEWSRCAGFGQIGQKRRERTCSDNQGQGTCGRLKELQERPCLLQQGK